ncbi:MAG: hypothetical protein Q7U60_12105 [Candidatus Methanoperedens sp.]|nr:hypothetical protein [Candidatus Methanoperedens sp.]
MSMLRKDILDCDLTKFPAVVYLALLFFISRIPFIALGFSAFTSPTDQDVLAVVNSAYLLRYEHVYAVSRFPGSPFYEIINSLLIGGGWMATNAATAIVSFFSVLLFGKILNILEIKNKALLLVTFTFIPVIWINSTITMDYMWSLMFLLSAFFFMFKERYVYSGIALSFATGSRITSLAMVIPLLYLMYHQKTDIKKMYTFLFTSTITTVLIFSPLLYTYGFAFLKYTPNEILLTDVVHGITTQLFDIPAIIIFIMAIIIKIDIPKEDFSYNLSLLVFVIFALLFIYVPAKPAYLIPAVPWGLITLSKSFHRTTVIILCVLIILNGIVSVEIQNNGEMIKIENGSVLKNYEERKPSILQSGNYLESLTNALKKG